MIAGVGIDVVSVDRMRRALERTVGLRDRVFTPGEIEAATRRGSPAASFAARFAAKEACRKALGEPVPWRDMEVVSAAGGAPQLHVAGRGDLRFHVTLTHTREIAAAAVVTETR